MVGARPSVGWRGPCRQASDNTSPIIFLLLQSFRLSSFPRLTQIVSDFCQNTFAGGVLMRAMRSAHSASNRRDAADFDETIEAAPVAEHRGQFALREAVQRFV